MIDELRGLSKETVLDFLRQSGSDTRYYSCYYHGLKPLLHDWEVYIFADTSEAVIVAVDPCHSRPEELADEEPFNGSHPRYFTERDSRISPVWLLAVTCKMMEERLRRLSKHDPRIFGLLLTGSHLLNYDDMKTIWDALDICVIDRMNDIEDLLIIVNPDCHLNRDLSLAFSCETGFSQDNVADAERKVSMLLGKLYPEVLVGLSNDANTEPTFNPSYLDWDFDNNDLYDDVPASLPLPAEETNTHVCNAMRSNPANKGCPILHVSSVSLTVSTGRKKFYAPGTVTFELGVEDGFYLSSDRFKCFVYTKDYFPMCNSVTDCKVRHSKGGILRIKMFCNRVWLPGDYLLLVHDGPEMTARYNFTLDENLTATLGEMTPCTPCGEEDVLISCMEANDDNWPLLANCPGTAQMRRHAIRYRQLDVYNTYRISLGGKAISSIRNILICTRNGDLDGQFFKWLYSLSTSGGLHFTYKDCSCLYDSSKPNPYEYLNEELGSCQKGVICLSGIGSLLHAGGKTIVRKILEMMRDKERGNRLWICGTRQELDTLLGMYPALGGLFLRGSRLEQEPYSTFDLVQAFYSQLRKEALEITPKVSDALSRAIIQGYRLGTLCNWSQEDIHRFVIEEVCPRYLEHSLSDILTEGLSPLSEKDLPLNLLTRSASSFEDSMRELNEMVGLNDVKQGVITMVNQARLFIERRRRGLKNSSNMVYHSIFTGNPGTGKTTVARKIGEIYHALGLLSKGKVITVDRTRLVGQYIGQTEDNMKMVLEEARGNVLFIDEAYTLYTGADDSKDFGMRVIDCLMAVLSQPDPDMLVIFAGYPSEMEALLSTNPGLSGRFPYRYLFPDYNAGELMQIAHGLFKHDDYILTDEADATLKDILDETLRKQSKDFSNARWIEQFVKNGVIPAFADRVFSTGCEDFRHIDASDIHAAYNRLNTTPASQKPHHKVVTGFSA